MSEIMGIADGALARLAAVLVQEEDPFADECSAEAVIALLSPQDRKVVSNIIRRVAELEERVGWEAAEAALMDVIRLLAGDRVGAC